MSESTPELVQIVTTVETQAEADAIASALLKQRLVACVQCEGPIQSTYWWRGEIESASEYRCTAKTLASRTAEVFAAIASLHPYEVPEIMAMPVVVCSENYREWLASQVS